MQYGLIGERLGHSFSKDIHEKIEDYTYTLKEIAKDELYAFMSKKEFKAINVTIPYKQDVIPYLDFVSDRAKAIGTVNTVVNKDGLLYGYNTDCLGLMALLEKNDICLKGKKVIILGTGGTSKTAMQVAKEFGVQSAVRVGRTKKEGCITYEEMYLLHTDADVIINTTPCGMYPDCQSSPVELDRFSSLVGVCDVVYNPLRTALVLEAKRLGIKACGGLYMLVSQAIYAVEKFTKKPYDESVADKIYADILSSKENIVLTGMPSCGKSTIGNMLASLTSRQIIDTDDMIEKKHQMKISEIFSKYGEQTFRDWESECIKEASKETGCIISTGGGAILREENVLALKQNGKLYFIDRDLENLMPTSDRPLAINKDEITKRYNERYPLYISCADQVVENNDTVKTVCTKILSLHFGS